MVIAYKQDGEHVWIEIIVVMVKHLSNDHVISDHAQCGLIGVIAVIVLQVVEKKKIANNFVLLFFFLNIKFYYFPLSTDFINHLITLFY